MAHFRYGYNALLWRVVRRFPFKRFVLRYITPAQRDPQHFFYPETVYALVGLASAILVFMA